jgi:nicotianamine synthase
MPETSMVFKCENAGRLQTCLRSFDVVYVAALVGNTGKEKREIFSAVLKRMRPGALLVVRTAHALRTLLYPVTFLYFLYCFALLTLENEDADSG